MDKAVVFGCRSVGAVAVTRALSTYSHGHGSSDWIGQQTSGVALTGTALVVEPGRWDVWCRPTAQSQNFPGV